MGKIVERRVDAIVEEDEDEEGVDEEKEKGTNELGWRKLKQIVLMQDVSAVVTNSDSGSILTEA